MSGLIELLFILLVAVAWGVYELRSLRQPPEPKPPAEAKPPPTMADRADPQSQRSE